MNGHIDSKPVDSNGFGYVRTCALALILVSCMAPGYAQACTDYGSYLHWVGMYDTPGYAFAVAVCGDYAFVCDWAAGVQVLDVSDPAKPIQVGHVDTPGEARAIALTEDCHYALVCDNNQTIQVLNISNPLQPSIVASVSVTLQAVGIAIDEPWAYVCDGNGGFRVINISNPENPYYVTGFYSGLCIDVDLSLSDEADFAYVANGDRLLVVEVTTPEQPQIRNHLVTPGGALGVAVSGDYVYLAGSLGLQVVDISNRIEPVPGALLELPDPFRVSVSGNYAYVACRGGGTKVVDISNPDQPFLVGTVDSNGSSRRVWVEGGFAYVANYDLGLQILDVSNPAEMGIEGALDIGGYLTGVALAGDVVCLADYAAGLHVVDVSNPALPESLGFVYTGIAFRVEISGTHAYVADYLSGLVVVDILNPSDPTIVGGAAMVGTAHGIALDDTLAYVGDTPGLQVVNISVPENPTIIATAPTTSEVWGIALAGRYAYVGTVSGGVWIFDVLDPANPIFQGSVATPGLAKEVAISGNYVFAGDENGLAVVNVTDPVHPVLAAYLDTPGYAVDITLQGDIAYVTDAYAGLLVVDLSDPEQPTVIGNVDTPGAAITSTVSGDLVFVADYDGGLRIFPAQCAPARVPDGAGDPTTAKLALSFRNPARPGVRLSYRIPSETLVNFRIFDTTGRLVRVLEDGVSRTAGDHEILWDGSDQFGNHVPSGVYFYRLEAGSLTETRKVTLIH